jgi:hypothetical protein
VERLKEYQQAVRMKAQQCFIFDLEKKMNLAMIFCQMQNIFTYVEKEMFCTEFSRLGYTSCHAIAKSIK